MTTTGERIVEVNGVDLCAEAFGDPADPLILLIHGAGSCMLSWDAELCTRIAGGGRHVVRYDLRDTGRSVMSPLGAPAYTMRDLVADAIALIGVFGAARGHLVGMSAGAAIAQLAALDHPERVASLVLFASTPGIPGEEGGDLPGVSDELRASFAQPREEPDWSDRAAVIEHLAEDARPYAARSRPFDAAAAREHAGRVFDRTTDIAAASTNMFAVGTGGPWRARLGQIAAPTLVIHGTEDPLFPYAHAVALADEIPGAELLGLEHTGHEYFPRHTWDVVVPAILRHTAGR